MGNVFKLFLGVRFYMDDAAINRLYKELPDDKVRLLCSYATRREGFLDILLSGVVMSSEEVLRLLGKVSTHRGSSMTVGGKEDFFTTNSYISLSTGFVSFKYSDPAMLNWDSRTGGVGVFVPLEKVLAYTYLGFSHCSSKGAIKSYDLNRENIRSAVHIARRDGELFDDGFGNVFEIALCATMKGGANRFGVESYTRLEIAGDVLVAIPMNEREVIEQELAQRQARDGVFLEKLSTVELNKRLSISIDDRDIWYPEKTIEFVRKMTKPVDLDALPIYWYSQKNLDMALRCASIGKHCAT